MNTKIPIAIAHIDPAHNIEFTPSPIGAIKVPNHLLTEISECQHEIEVSRAEILGLRRDLRLAQAEQPPCLFSYWHDSKIHSLEQNLKAQNCLADKAQSTINNLIAPYVAQAFNKKHPDYQALAQAVENLASFEQKVTRAIDHNKSLLETTYSDAVHLAYRLTRSATDAQNHFLQLIETYPALAPAKQRIAALGETVKQAAKTEIHCQLYQSGWGYLWQAKEPYLASDTAPYINRLHDDLSYMKSLIDPILKSYKQKLSSMSDDRLILKNELLARLLNGDSALSPNPNESRRSTYNSDYVPVISSAPPEKHDAWWPFYLLNSFWHSSKN